MDAQMTCVRVCYGLCASRIQRATAEYVHIQIETSNFKSGRLGTGTNLSHAHPVSGER